MKRSQLINILIPKISENILKLKTFRCHSNPFIVPIRTFCTQTSNVKHKIDVSQLDGVSYLNKRLNELQQLENPTYLVHQEIKEINRKLGNVQDNFQESITTINCKLSALQKSDEIIVKKIDDLDAKIQNPISSQEEIFKVPSVIQSTHQYSNSSYTSSSSDNSWSSTEKIAFGIGREKCNKM